MCYGTFSLSHDANAMHVRLENHVFWPYHGANIYKQLYQTGLYDYRTYSLQHCTADICWLVEVLGYSNALQQITKRKQLRHILLRGPLFKEAPPEAKDVMTCACASKLLTCTYRSGTHTWHLRMKPKCLLKYVT